MSELAFDKDGEPIELHEDLEFFRIRVFPNPGARGTCAVFRDKSGAPAYIERDGSFLDFHERVGGKPGYFRLDQCDSSRQTIPNAAPAYVLIPDGPSSGGEPGEHATSTDPLVAALREAVGALAETARAQTRAHGEVLSGAAEILRAADIAGISRRNAPAVLETKEQEPNGDDDEEDDEDDEEEDEAPPAEVPQEDARIVREVMSLLKEITPMAKAWVMSKIAKNASSSPPPAAAPNSAAPPPPPAASAAPGADPAGSAAAGPSSPPQQSDTTAAPNAATRAPEAAPRNASPTAAQLAHLLAILARLTPREQAIAQEAAARMPADVKAQWLTDLSAMTVEQAAHAVRSLIPQPSAPASDEEAA